MSESYPPLVEERDPPPTSVLPDPVSGGYLAELRRLRQRYLTLLEQYVIERRGRLLAAGLSETEANGVAQATRERWGL